MREWTLRWTVAHETLVHTYVRSVETVNTLQIEKVNRELLDYFDVRIAGPLITTESFNVNYR